jgi:L-xylulokinase
MDEMWRVACETIRQVLQTSDVTASKVAGVSYSAHGKGLYAVDRYGNPVRNGIVSSDSRAMPLVRRWRSTKLEERTYPLGFQQIWPSHPASLLAWLKEYEPDNYCKIDRILMAHDWIRYKMTGQLNAEVTNISGSNLFNVRREEYDRNLLELFGIEEMSDCVAPIIDSSQSSGNVSKSAAAETGLNEGTPVFGGFFDVVSAAVCSGLSDDTLINVTMGTWTIVTWVDNKISQSNYPYTWGRYCITGKYFVHEGSPTSASNLEWFVRTLMGDKSNPYELANAMVASVEKGSTNIIFFPYLFASNLGDNLSGGFYGLANAHNLAHVVQAIYEGICFSQQVHLERIVALAGTARPLRLTGRPSRSKELAQMVADISGMPVEVVHVAESGCKGAAIAAAVGSGVFPSFREAMGTMCSEVSPVEPDASVAQRYQDKYARFRQLAEMLNTVTPPCGPF